MKTFFAVSALWIFSCIACEKISLAQSEHDQASWQFQILDGSVTDPFADKKNKAVVLVFISTDCPIANSYQPQLAAFNNQYSSKGVQFFLVHSSPQITVESARQHADDYTLSIPVILDKDRSIARRVGATVTPEAVIVQRDKEVQRDTNEPAYRGRIDNLYEDFGKKRASATEHYLRDALDQILAGKPVETTRTKPIGCFISFETITDDQSNDESGSKQDANSDKKSYDPLQVGDEKFETLLMDIKDTERERTILVKVYLPKASDKKSKSPAPVILFSHGLGGSRDACTYLGEHWAKRGFIGVFLQHPGSDESVWKNTPLRDRMNAMNRAANAESLQLRAGDVKAVIDQLEKWNVQEDHQFCNRLKLSRIGMSGHSFGAVTTQAVSGQTYLRQSRFHDKRITAAIAFSPSSPRIGNRKAAFSSITIPFMGMTGSKDVAPIGGADVQSRLDVFENLPDGNKYQLFLNEAEHSAFADGRLPGDDQKNPNHHRLIKAFSTAFWEAFLKKDDTAKQWLSADERKEMLQKGDRLQQK
jgi:predicted dienelactone hydrolase/thiol-disulfide isomerase/thioredoxin